MKFSSFDKLPDVEWMKVTELAAYMNEDVGGRARISTRTLRRWCENGQLPASRRGGGHWYVHIPTLKKVFDELLDEPLTVFETALIPHGVGDDEETVH